MCQIAEIIFAPEGCKKSANKKKTRRQDHLAIISERVTTRSSNIFCFNKISKPCQLRGLKAAFFLALQPTHKYYQCILPPPILVSLVINFHHRIRLVSLQLFLILLFSLLLARFYILQVEENEKWLKIANRQHYFTIQEPAKRGVFYSNATLRGHHPAKPHPFVVDIEKFHLHIDPLSFPAQVKEEMTEQLSTLLALSTKERTHLSSQFNKKSRNRKLCMWLGKEQQESILTWWRPYAKKNKIPHNALFFVTDYQRSYPFGHLLGQVIHTIRGCKDQNQVMPTGGAELYFDAYLKGTPGKRRLMRSPRNSFEMGEVIETPVRGADVYLTIDHHLQAIVEQELERAVKKSKAKAGKAVMMNPKNGEILAIAHYPFFNPGQYQVYFNDPELLVHAQLGAVVDALEPGSVMKPFTVCSALLANDELAARGQKPIFDPSEKTATSNGKFPGRSRPLVDTHLHRFLNMSMAMQKSSNIYMGRLTEKIVSTLGGAWYRAVLQERFGFGKRTGIEFPAESPGVLPVIGKRHANGSLEWSTSTPFSLAMGYNLQVNGIQLLRAYAVLANGGYLVQPTLIRGIVGEDREGKEVVFVDNSSADRVKSFPRVLSKQIVDEVVQAMKYTTKPGGSAAKAEIYGYTEAGKTSTTKKIVNGAYADTYRASFVGFVPVTDPAFVLFVMMDEPSYGYIPGIGKTHHGGTATAPVFAKIAKRSLAYLGVAPDDPYGYPNGDPRSDRSKADWVTEAKVLQQHYEEWNKH